MKKYFLGKTKLQSLFERLFYISLKGMNYGTGSNYENSGEKNIVNLLNKNFKNLLIFDVGANKGQYSKFLIDSLQVPYKIYAFEPTKYCIGKLQEIQNPNLVVCGFGLSKSNTTTVIHYDTEGSTWASIDNTDYGRHQKNLAISEEIQLKRIDDFCSKKNIPHIHLLKIDVEGHEIDVLEGAEEMLESNKIDVIQFEFGLASLYSKQRLMDFFKILPNYTIYRITQDGFRKITYHEAYEIYLTTNYIAVNNQIKLKF